MTDLFVSELTEGIGPERIRAGIIKVVTGAPRITPVEQELLTVAGRAAACTGAAVITHTEGVLGNRQQEILAAAGVPPQRVMIGHSCSSADQCYHERVLRAGSYLAFDRFGMQAGVTDQMRVLALGALLQAGWRERLLVSHDSVWHWVGGPQIGAGAQRTWVPTRFCDVIVPQLRNTGVTEAEIDLLLSHNPRRFFQG